MELLNLQLLQTLGVQEMKRKKEYEKILNLLLVILLVISGCGQGVSFVQNNYIEIKDNYESESFLQKEEKTEEDKIVTYLEEQVPEISKYAEYIAKESNEEASITIRTNTIENDLYKDGEGSAYLGKYYGVYVGEQWPDHSVMWDQFYVSINYDKIYWQDTIRSKGSEFDMYTLDEWRNSQYYRKQFQ